VPSAAPVRSLDGGGKPCAEEGQIQSFKRYVEEERRHPKAAKAWRPLGIQPLSNPSHHSSPFLAIHSHLRHLLPLPTLGAFSITVPCPSPALGAANLRHPPKPCYRHLSRHIVLLCPLSCPRHSPILYPFDFIKIVCYEWGTSLLVHDNRRRKQHVCSVVTKGGESDCWGYDRQPLRGRSSGQHNRVGTRYAFNACAVCGCVSPATQQWGS